MAAEVADHRERELQDRDQPGVRRPELGLRRPVDELVTQSAHLLAEVSELVGGQVEQQVAELVGALPLAGLGWGADPAIAVSHSKYRSARTAR